MAGPRPRPSALDQVQLTDGRSAWAVARDRGMSEAAFRSRLSRLGPDGAALGPFVPADPDLRDAKRERRLAYDAAIRAAHIANHRASLWPSYLDVRHCDYSGVIWSSPEFRLIVTPRGASYCVQERDAGGWFDLRKCDTARQLKPFVLVVMFDPPSGLFEAVASLPDNPRDCLLVPFKSSPPADP